MKTIDQQLAFDAIRELPELRANLQSHPEFEALDPLLLSALVELTTMPPVPQSRLETRIRIAVLEEIQSLI